MGQQKVSAISTVQERARFIKQLLNDVRAMQYMLDANMIESNVARIGAEQEYCLVNDCWEPAINSDEILKAIDDEHFTTELARYNLEINLDPFPLKGTCFSEMQNQLEELLEKARTVAGLFDSKVVLTGILPTITKRHIELDHMTPSPRYYALNEAIKAKRGQAFELHIRGADELSLLHDSVLFEACNTSFQMHLQISPEDFISSYNWAQAISGPILSVCTNSPLLLGKELWSETRIALFRQSIDIRPTTKAIREKAARVDFGNHWAEGSAVDIFKNDIANHKVMLHDAVEEDSLALATSGKAPKLRALQLLNGTIYKWNRPCYGVGDGVPHLRIENRYIPSGPTVIDQMANFALWVGVMKARPKACDTMKDCMSFKTARSNFIKAARYGTESMQHWMGKEYTPKALLEEVLIPMAAEGLKNAGVNDNEAKMYLDVIAARVNSNTGANWITKNYDTLKKKHQKAVAQKMIVAAIYENQWNEGSVDTWPMLKSQGFDIQEPKRVGSIMTPKVFTVHHNDVAELATNIMDWKDIHHVPVVDDHDQLVGLLTWTHIIHADYSQSLNSEFLVQDIMTKSVVTAHPTTLIQDAIATMKKHEIGCLPVVDNEELVGIITIKDVFTFDTDNDFH
ncbi:MAG: CBS domain-containing protein [Gilvibacter sp.]